MPNVINSSYALHLCRWYKFWATEQHRDLILKGGINFVPLSFNNDVLGGTKYVPLDLKGLIISNI